MDALHAECRRPLRLASEITLQGVEEMLTRAPLSQFSVLTALGLLVMGSETIVGMWVSGRLAPAGFVVAAFPVLSGMGVLSGIRWMPAVGAVVALLGMWIGFMNPIYTTRLTHPELGVLFWLAYLQLGGMILGLMAGILVTLIADSANGRRVVQLAGTTKSSG
jgi:hypothetical protein